VLGPGVVTIRGDDWDDSSAALAAFLRSGGYIQNAMETGYFEPDGGFRCTFNNGGSELEQRSLRPPTRAAKRRGRYFSVLRREPHRSHFEIALLGERFPCDAIPELVAEVVQAGVVET
jgi:hypothetical protein